MDVFYSVFKERWCNEFSHTESSLFEACRTGEMNG